MTIDLPLAVLDAADVSAVTQLVLTERESRDLGRWERMRACFHTDSLVRLSWFNGTGANFVEGSIDMARRGLPAKHRLGPVIVRLGDASKTSRRAVASMSAIIDIPTKLGDVDAVLSSHARFVYRAECRKDYWAINGFDAIYVRDEFTTPIPGQAVQLTPADLAGFRPTYRMLSYLLTSGGYRVNGELPGEDRPETVAGLEAELTAWLA